MEQPVEQSCYCVRARVRVYVRVRVFLCTWKEKKKKALIKYSNNENIPYQF